MDRQPKFCLAGTGQRSSKRVFAIKPVALGPADENTNRYTSNRDTSKHQRKLGCTKEELKITDEEGISFVEKIRSRDGIQKAYQKLKSIDFCQPDSKIELAFNLRAIGRKTNTSVWQKLTNDGHKSGKSNFGQEGSKQKVTIVNPRKKISNSKKSKGSPKRKVFKRTQDSQTSLNELLCSEENKRSDIERPGLFNFNQPQFESQQKQPKSHGLEVINSNGGTPEEERIDGGIMGIHF